MIGLTEQPDSTALPQKNRTQKLVKVALRHGEEARDFKFYIMFSCKYTM